MYGNAGRTVKRGEVAKKDKAFIHVLSILVSQFMIKSLKIHKKFTIYF